MRGQYSSKDWKRDKYLFLYNWQTPSKKRNRWFHITKNREDGKDKILQEIKLLTGKMI